MRLYSIFNIFKFEVEVREDWSLVEVDGTGWRLGSLKIGPPHHLSWLTQI